MAGLTVLEMESLVQIILQVIVQDLHFGFVIRIVQGGLLLIALVINLFLRGSLLLPLN